MFGRVDVQIIQNLPLIFSLFCFFFILDLVISSPSLIQPSSIVFNRITHQPPLPHQFRLSLTLCLHCTFTRWWPLFKFHWADWDEPDWDAVEWSVSGGGKHVNPTGTWMYEEDVFIKTKWKVSRQSPTCGNGKGRASEGISCNLTAFNVWIGSIILIKKYTLRCMNYVDDDVMILSEPAAAN